MPDPLSETLKRIRSSSRPTLTPTTGETPAVSQASRELSTNSFKQTLANSSCDTPTSVESWRASKYSAAREISKVVLCSLGISSSRRSSDDTDKGSDPKKPNGRDTPKDAPALVGCGHSKAPVARPEPCAGSLCTPLRRAVFPLRRAVFLGTPLPAPASRAGFVPTLVASWPLCATALPPQRHRASPNTAPRRRAELPA